MTFTVGIPLSDSFLFLYFYRFVASSNTFLIIILSICIPAALLLILLLVLVIVKKKNSKRKVSILSGREEHPKISQNEIEFRRSSLHTLKTSESAPDKEAAKERQAQMITDAV